MKKSMIIFVCMLLMGTLIFGFDNTIVLGATQYNPYEDWESYNIGVSSGSGTYTQWARTSGEDFEIVNQEVTGEGSKSLYLMMTEPGNVPDVGYIKLKTGNIANSDYISSFSFWIEVVWYDGGPTQNNNYYIYFQNDSFYSQLDMRLWVAWHGFNRWDLLYRDVFGTWQNLYTLGSGGGAGSKTILVDITHISDNIMNYSVYDSSKTFLTSAIDSCRITDDWTAFSRINITGQKTLMQDPADYFGMYLGDMNLTTDYVPTEYDEDELALYTSYCMDGHITYDMIGEKYIETYNPVVRSCNIRAVDLYISRDQYNLVSSDPSDYKLYINGGFIGEPSYIFLGESAPDYTMRWIGFGANISEEMPVFEFSCSKDYLGFNWYGLGVVPNEGDILSKQHPVSFMFGDGIWNGNPMVGSKNIMYCFYYDYWIPPEDNPGYDDDITISPPPYYLYNEIKLYYWLSIKQPQNYIQIWNTDTGLRVGNDQGYGNSDYSDDGKPVSDWSGQESFLPFQAGNYTVTLYRDGANQSTFSFEVLALVDDDFIITTYPNPSKLGQDYNIFYRFYALNGIDGVIYHGDTPYPGNATFFSTVTVNTSGNFTFPGDVEGLTYWMLTQTVGGFSQVKDINAHWVGDVSGSNWITVEFSELFLGRIDWGDFGEWFDVHQNVDWSHIYLDSSVAIFLNGETYFYDVSDIPTGSHRFAFDESGVYYFTLEVETAEGWMEVARSSEFTIHAETEEEPDVPSLIEDVFTPVQRVIVGIALCLIITFMPFIVSLKLKQAHVTINIPPILYGICFGSAVMVCYIVGFFPFAIAFFLCFVLVAIVTLTWVYKQKSPGGGED